MDDVMKAAREAAVEAGCLAGEFVNSSVINIAISAYEAKLDETTVRVPREPTEAMLDAAVAALELHTSETEYSTPLAVYRAMLAATSPPSTTE